jgi:hypothetical protein
MHVRAVVVAARTISSSMGLSCSSRVRRPRLTITPIADGMAEGPETVILTLSNGDPNFTPGAAATATITMNE